MAKKVEKIEAVAVSVGTPVKEGSVTLKKIEGPGAAVLALEDVGILRVGLDAFPQDFNPIDCEVTGRYFVYLDIKKKG